MAKMYLELLELLLELLLEPPPLLLDEVVVPNLLVLSLRAMR